MRAPLRKAVDLIVFEGKTQRAAAADVGMNETSLGRALARPAVAIYVEELKAQLIQQADDLKGRARQMAILVGIELLQTAKSESVKARMVEFFAGEAKSGNQINVQINNGGAYEYARPGARVVEINPPTDKQSDGEPS